jgi:hypothetical protein
MTEANSEFLGERNDPVFVVNNDKKIGYQACFSGECSELFEVSSVSNKKPSMCN